MFTSGLFFQDGFSALHLAATNPSIHMINFLVGCGADINTEDSVSGFSLAFRASGVWPSHCVSCPHSFRSLCYVHILAWPYPLRSYACASFGQFGSTPMHYAALCGLDLIVARLAELGSDVTKPSSVR